MDLKFEIYNTKTTWTKSYKEWCRAYESVLYFESCVKYFITMRKRQKNRYNKEYKEIIEYLVSSCPKFNEMRKKEEMKARQN